MKNLLLTLIALLMSSTIYSAEIIPVWDRSIEGEVQYMDFLKGQKEVLMLVGAGP